MQENYEVQLVNFATAEKKFQYMPMRQVIRKIWSNGGSANGMGQVSDISEVSAAGEVGDVDECSFVRLYVKVPNDYLVYSQNKDISINHSDLFGGREYFSTNYTEVTRGRAKWDWPEPANDLEYNRYVEATGGSSVERFEHSRFHSDIDFLEIRIEDVLQVVDFWPVDLSLFYYGFSRDKKGFSVRHPVRFQRLYSVHPKSGGAISIVPMVSKGNYICVDASVNVFIDVETLDFLKGKEVVFSGVDEIGKVNDRDKESELDVRDESAIMEVCIINALARRWQQEKESFVKVRPHDAYYRIFKTAFPDSIFIVRSQLSRRGKLESNRVLYKILSRLVFDVSRTTGSHEYALRKTLDVSALGSLKKEMPYAGERLLILNEMARNIKGYDRSSINIKRSFEGEARNYGLDDEEVDFLIDILFDGALV